MSTVSAKLRFAVLSRDEFTCQYCGRSGNQVPLHVDHIVPRSAGGASNASNLITACADCNLGKGGRKAHAAGLDIARPTEANGPSSAIDATVSACQSEQDAIAASITLSGLTYREIAARMGVSKSLVNAMVKGERPLSARRTQAFCNATGTYLIVQYRDLERALHVAAGRQRERDRIAAIVAPTRAAWRAA